MWVAVLAIAFPVRTSLKRQSIASDGSSEGGPTLGSSRLVLGDPNEYLVLEYGIHFL